MIIDISSEASNAEALLYQSRKESAKAAREAAAAEAKVNTIESNNA